ncbi:dihydrofolate reductase [Ahrensia sp. 13_GOM-1096m]|uniref:dihydrofolate reductase n=1 Tax=Ahrensia sp. 13_GOM-1096m TaxID=1380380 RepID=UPI00047BC885|nr:dihydrofolate reductase [Ahrensia sp. 13_GOM-1096m]
MKNIEPHIEIVVAVSQNGVIGREGDMPWRLSADLKRFKSLTIGKPVIMGRKTFESIGKALPNRLNIVITRDADWHADDVMRVGSIGAAVDLALAHLESAEPDPDDLEAPLPDEICIIGGGQIYAQAINMAHTLYVTHVLAEIDGDTHFPEIDENLWLEVSSEDVPKSDKDSVETRFVIYERKSAE